MTIVHIVLFEFKPTTTVGQIDEACKRMLALETKCVHPATKQPYIKSFEGGTNNSPEGLAHPHTHGFVVHFESEQDREYYLNKDPEHLAFIDFVKERIVSVKVFDFEPGKF